MEPSHELDSAMQAMTMSEDDNDDEDDDDYTSDSESSESGSSSGSNFIECDASCVRCPGCGGNLPTSACYFHKHNDACSCSSVSEDSEDEDKGDKSDDEEMVSLPMTVDSNQPTLDSWLQPSASASVSSSGNVHLPENWCGDEGCGHCQEQALFARTESVPVSGSTPPQQG